MRKSSFLRNISTVTLAVFGIIIGCNLVMFPPLATVASPYYFAQYKPSPEEQALTDQIKELMRQEEQISGNAVDQMLNVLTPEQRREYELAKQEKREPKVQLDSTQTSLMEFIVKERDSQLLTRSQLIKSLLEQLKQKKAEQERQTN